MAKGPGLYSDIGKKARDLLYKDYQTDQKFTFTTYSPVGVAITTSGTKKGELFVADINTQLQLKNKNVTTDFKVDTSSNLVTTITLNEPAPGVKAILSLKAPDQSSSKLELQYLHDYVGISSSFGLTASPLVNASAVVGSNGLALGADVAFDSKSGNFTKYDAGLSYSSVDLIASFALNDKGDSLNASYYHLVNPFTAVGAEVSHSLSTNENTMTLGTQHAWDPLTTVKARVNNNGKVSALIQHEWRPKSFFTVSGELDARSIDKRAKVGLALAIKP